MDAGDGVGVAVSGAVGVRVALPGTVFVGQMLGVGVGLVRGIDVGLLARQYVMTNLGCNSMASVWALAK